MERVELATDWGREVRVHSVIHICIHTLNGRGQAIGVYTLVDRSGKHPFFLFSFLFGIALFDVCFGTSCLRFLSFLSFTPPPTPTRPSLPPPPPPPPPLSPPLPSFTFPCLCCCGEFWFQDATFTDRSFVRQLRVKSPIC